MTRKRFFGSEIRRLRKMIDGGTQEWLANKVGVEKTYISKIETGNIKTMPSFDLITKLEKALLADAGYLVDLAAYYNPRKLDAVLEEKPELSRIIRKMYESE